MVAVLIGIALGLVYALLRYLWDKLIDKYGYSKSGLGGLLPGGCLISILEGLLIIVLLVWLIL